MAAADDGDAEVAVTMRQRDATTSAAVGIDGAAPIRCTQIDAAMLAYSNASRMGLPSASCAATAPTKQSPAPVVSTASTMRPGMIQRLAIHQRNHAALAECDADDFARAGLQRARGFDEQAAIVGIAKFGAGEQAELAFVEDEDIDQIKQVRDRTRWRAPD